MKKFLQLTMMMLLLFGSLKLSAGIYSGGTGTSGDPYQIATLADLIELSTTSADWIIDTYIIQTAHIDATSTNTLNSGDGFSPIGTELNVFAANYDGQNHTIDNLYINRGTTDRIGLFGYIEGVGDKVKNLGLNNVNITGRNYVGGLIGWLLEGTIINCYTTGSINGADYVGGFAGRNGNLGLIQYCYTTSNVTANETVGGFVGYNQNIISYCYLTGDVIAKATVGGFVGLNDPGTISNCYSLGNITRSTGANSNFGGFCGINFDGTIQKCYSTGKVYQSTATIWASSDKGFVGYDGGTTTYADNFFDQTSSQQTIGTGATATTSANMKTQSTFTNWDFTAGNTNWIMSSPIAFAGYPTLQWTGGYSVAPVNTPLEIASLPNLVWLAEAMSISPTEPARWSGEYIQTENINMWTTASWDGNKGWTPIGTIVASFAGNYNGQSYTLTNIYINRPSTNFIGFIGYALKIGDMIKNLGLINVNITGQSDVAGLVGYSKNSIISNCYVKGNVRGVAEIAGLVGQNYLGTISNCFTTGIVTGSFHTIGGLVGANKQGIISNSYTTSKVTGSYNGVGGLVGYNFNSTVSNCYSTGSVTGTVTDIGGLIGLNIGGTYNNCFWDTETSGMATSGGGTGKTTAEMKTQSTFTTSPSNWDFTANTGIWKIESGSYISYPYLQAITYDVPGASPEINPILGLEMLGPANPSPFTATINSTTQIDLSWALNGNGDDVVLAYNTENAFGEPSEAYTVGDAIGTATVTYVGTGTSFNHTALDVNTRYFYKIWSKDGSYVYSSGATDDEWTLANVPAAPTVINSTYTTLDVVVNINENPDGTEFAIHETTTDQFVQADGSLGATAVWITAIGWGIKAVTGLSSNIQYTFEVKARNGGNTETAYSTSASGTTLECFAGQFWTPQTASEFSLWESVTFGNGLFVATSQVGKVMTSPDGITWTSRTAAEASFWSSVTFGNNLFVAVSAMGKVMTSPDGITWTSRTAAEANAWYSVTYGNGLFVALAPNGTNNVMTSPDGIVWTRHTAPVSGWTSLTYGNGLFVAVAVNGTNRVMTSPDGINWTGQTAAEANLWFGITYGNGLFVAVSINGVNRVMTSTNGINWTARTAAGESDWVKLTYGNGLFVAVAYTGTNRVMTSADAITWTIRPAVANEWKSVVYGNGLFVAVSSNGTNQVMTSDCEAPVITVTTQAASAIAATSATGNGNITSIGSGNATNRGVIYYPYTGEDKIIGDAEVTNVSETGDFGIGTFTATFTALSVNTRYNARAHATNTGDGTQYGDRVDFWTLANVPVAPTVNNPNYTSLDVAVNANSNPTGTEFAIHETTTNKFVQADGTLGASTVWQTVAIWATKTVTGLSSNTQYTFEVKARNGGITETAYSTSASGTTLECFAGQFWTAYTDAVDNAWSSVTYGNGLYVAIGNSGESRVMTSPDGKTWTARTAAEFNSWTSVTYGNGLFVAVAQSGTNRVMTSPDGINWTARTAASVSNWWKITYGNGLFVAVASNGTDKVMTSPDGINWTSRNAAEANTWSSVTYGNGLFVAVAFDGTNRVMTSPDGITWTARSAAEANQWSSVTYGNGLFAAVAYSGTNRVMTSPDGITWTAHTAAEANNWSSVTYGNGLFAAVAYTGTNRVMTSPDGITWTGKTALPNFWYSITYGNESFVAVAAAGTKLVMTSDCEAPVITVTTQAASAIAASSATGNGNITNIGSGNATNRGIIYYPYTGTDKIIGNADVTNVSETGDFGIGTFTATFTSLSVNTRYNARAHATNTYGTGYGARVDFWTLANVPAAPTVNNPTATTLDVAVNGNGNPDITTYAIYETSTTKFVQADGTLDDAEVWQTAANWGTKTVTGLSTGVTYTFKVKARNGANVETAYGEETSRNTCSNPTDGGEIDGAQTICYNTAADELGSVTEASDYGGTLEYQWQSNTTSSTFTFDDIIGASSNTYTPGTLTQTSWFRRLARVSCKTDWIGAAESNVIKITVDPATVSGTISGNEIITVHTSTGDLTVSGQTGNVLQWEKKLNDGEWAIISGTAAATYSETPETVGSWSYRALVQSGVCDSDYTEAHIIDVIPAEPDHFTLTSPGTAISGAASGNFVIALFDQYNNPTYCRANTTFNLTTNSTSSSHIFTPASPLQIGTGTYSSTFTYTESKAGTHNITASYVSGSSGLTGETLTVSITVTLPGPWAYTSIGASNGTTEFFPEVNAGTYKLTAQGLSAPKTDVMNFVYQQLCGNGTVIARLSDVVNGGWAGVMMRESNAPGAKAVLFKTKLYNPTAIVGIRSSTNGNISNTNQNLPNLRWMKIQRTNASTFAVYMSYDGTTWVKRHTATVAMNNCINAGFFTENAVSGRTTTAWMDHAEVVGYLKDTDEENTDIINQDLFEVMVYPNPASDRVTITIPDNEEKVKVTLISSSGLVVETSEFNAMEVEYYINHIKPGMYLLRFERDGMIVNKRLVVL